MNANTNNSSVVEFCSDLVNIDFRNLSDPDEAMKWQYSSTDIFILSVIIPFISFIGVSANGSFLYMFLFVSWRIVNLLWLWIYSIWPFVTFFFSFLQTLFIQWFCNELKQTKTLALLASKFLNRVLGFDSSRLHLVLCVFGILNCDFSGTLFCYLQTLQSR